MNVVFVAVGAYLLGLLTGILYRKYVEGWFDRNVWKKLHANGVDIPVVVLSVALVLGGSLWWQDRNRWNEYLECQEKISTAQRERADSTLKRDVADAWEQERQRDLNEVLHDIAQTVPLDGEPPTQEQQQAALDAYARLEPVSLAAERASDALVDAQNELDKVREEWPLPDCGASPN